MIPIFPGKSPGTSNLVPLASAALLTGLLVAGWTGPASAGDAQEEASVRMFEQAFLPTQVTIINGGTVTWEWRDGDHVVTSGQSSNAEDNPGALFEGAVDATNPSFSFRFDIPGNYPFFDGLNEQSGGVGTVTVLSDAITVLVKVVDNAYIPEDVFVFEGDTIHWRHDPNEAFHTVTSGRSSDPADNPGALFDEESSDARPNFFYTFEDPMIYDYFCRPHEHLDMIGRVIVQRYFLRGDYDLNGDVDFSDAITLLKTIFLGDPEPGNCRDAGDADDSGQTDFSDAIHILTFELLGGVEIPKPFPTPGPDRTEDELLCLP